MGPTLAAIAFSALGVIAAFMFRPRQAHTRESTRAAAFWLSTTPFIYFIPNALLVLFICGAMLVAVSQGRAINRAALYFGALVAIPTSIIGAVPFPGLNYLVELDFSKTACLTLLLPFALVAKAPAVRRYAPTAGVILTALALLYSAQIFRAANLTSGIRASLDFFLLLVAPYIAIVRFLKTPEDVEGVLSMFLFIGVLFFFSEMISVATDWNFYNFAAAIRDIPRFADFRYGVVRTGVTVVPILAGFVMALAFLSVEYFRRLDKMGAALAWTLRSMFVIGCLVTVSRGAWLAFAAAGAAFWLFADAPRALRPLAVAFGVLVVLPAAVYLFFNADFSGIDKFGTFDFRRELLRASFVQIAEKPLFGDPNYIASGNFDHLEVGGLIDVVNYYLEIVLQHGIVGLVLFFWIFVSLFVGLLSLGKGLKARDDRRAELQRAVMLAILGSYLLMMATISAVSICAHIGVFACALAAAFLAIERKRLRSPDNAARLETAPAEVASGDLYG